MQSLFPSHLMPIKQDRLLAPKKSRGESTIKCKSGNHPVQREYPASFKNSNPCEIVSHTSSSSNSTDGPVIPDILLRKQLMVQLSASLVPELDHFINIILDEFVSPMWTTVSCTSVSQTTILTQVCAFPVAFVPRSWSNSVLGDFLVCRLFSGNWTLVNTCHLFGETIHVSIPARLQVLLVALNAFDSRSNITLIFEPESGVAFLSEIQFNQDIMFVYTFDEETCSFKLHKTICSIPPGAVHVQGMHKGKLIFTVGCSIVIEDILGSASVKTIPDALLAGIRELQAPVSVQGVVPFVTPAGRILYLSDGCVLATEVSGLKETKCVLRDPQVTYVALACDFKSMRAVVIGFGRQNRNHIQYITVYDLCAEFVVSTVSCHQPHYSSIISVCINPANSDVTILGRSNQSAQHGAISYTYPSVYN